MAGLRDKLERRRRALRAKGERDEPEAAGASNEVPAGRSALLAELQRRIHEIERGGASAQEDAEIAEPRVERAAPVPLPGARVETPHGPVWVHRTTVRDYFHGDVPVTRFLDHTGDLAAFSPRSPLDAADLANPLFVDTETTGLGHGTGTFPFLVGVARFAGDVMEVTQYVCEDPGQEPALLHLLAQHFSQASSVVTFNGKAFDIPLINTRFILHRMANPGARLPHLDLLTVARRIFSRRLSDRSLQNLERVVLGFHREGDIPGSAIPAVYVQWLDGRDGGDMARVLAHNADDLCALAALGGELARMYRDPSAVAHVKDHLGLARYAVEAGEDQRAQAHLRRVQVEADADDRTAGLHMQARMAARAKDYDTAARLWHAVLEVDGDDAWAHLCLAKYYEHRKKDWDKALVHARAAADLEGEASERRLMRIARKQQRARR